MSINRVIIEGYLTRDVEMRATASGLAVAGFTVAVNEKRKNAEGEYVDAPVFVKCSLFGTRAEKLSKYLIKGTNTFAASMCAMSDETKLSDALEIADSTGNAFVYKGGRLMGVVLSCDKYAEVSKGK